MLLKSSLATDYSGVPTRPTSLTPQPALEFIQRTTIVDFTGTTSTSAPLGNLNIFPFQIVIDLPAWANFSRYNIIQFSLGAFTTTNGSSDRPTLLLRRNNITSSSTFVSMAEAIASTTTSLRINTNSGAATLIADTVGNSTSTNYVRNMDIFVTQHGVYTETNLGNFSSFNSLSPLNRSTATTYQTGISSVTVPGFLDNDTVGILLGFSGGGAFGPPANATAGGRTSDYRLDCTAYGWLR